MNLSPSKVFKFEHCGVHLANNPEHYFKAVHVYKFNADEKNRYLVTVEEYQHHVYILKFCLEDHQDNNDKFNILLNIGYANAKKVILTCVQIGLSIYEKNPLASFGFIASPTIDELGKTGFNNTKRLLVYKYFTQFFFPSEDFTHLHGEEQSWYLILNKNYENQEPNAVQKIKDMLKLDLAAVVRNHSL